MSESTQEPSSATLSTNEQADIEEFRQLKRSIKQLEQLRNLPHIQKWINEESERQLGEYITTKFNEFMIKYPFVTIDDLNWLRFSPTDEYRILLPECVQNLDRNGDNNDFYRQVGVIRHIAQPNEHYYFGVTSMRDFLPPNMVHLWDSGHGYESLIEY